MKLKIKVKVLTSGCMPKISEKGDWIDLRVAKDMYFQAPIANTLRRKDLSSVRDVEFDYQLAPLGVAMELPAGCEAIAVPRSSTYKCFGVIQANHVGVIDNTYSGNNDQWHMPMIALRETMIDSHSRVCQFRIQLSQKATLWQKIKWFLSSGIKLVEVDNLGDNNRGGIGSTGIK